MARNSKNNNGSGDNDSRIAGFGAVRRVFSTLFKLVAALGASLGLYHSLYGNKKNQD